MCRIDESYHMHPFELDGSITSETVLLPISRLGPVVYVFTVKERLCALF